MDADGQSFGEIAAIFGKEAAWAMNAHGCLKGFGNGCAELPDFVQYSRKAFFQSVKQAVNEHGAESCKPRGKFDAEPVQDGGKGTVKQADW